LKFTVTLPLPLTEEGLKLALTPAGRLAADTDTLPVKPPSEAIVIVAVGFDPGVKVTD
jgi:hypothetical protein